MRPSPLEVPLSATNRLPALSKANPCGEVNSEVKMLCTPCGVNSKILEPLASAPDTNRFCADAPAQIRIAAPKHATLLNNCPARTRVHLNLVSVSLFFIVAPQNSVFAQNQSPGRASHWQHG